MGDIKCIKQIKAKPLDNLDLLDILTPRPACRLARLWRAGRYP
jgi:hypothetical protein